MNKRIAVIFEDKHLQRSCSDILQNLGYCIHWLERPVENFAQITKFEAILILCTTASLSAAARNFLTRLNHSGHVVPVIFLCRQLTVDTAVELMRNGASDVISPPLTKEILSKRLAAVLKTKQKRKNPFQVNEQKLPESSAIPMIGASDGMMQVRKNISLIADTDISVLISGESGTGKELAARTIHHQSENPEAHFVKINCAAIPRELLESELFGHVKGAFTGATAPRMGAFIQANGGTIFLDEIGDMPIDLQPKLLHAVEEKIITPVGTGEALPVKVRIITATNQNLEKMVERGTFRNDLFHRLNGYPLTLPPLRERCDDIPQLLEHFSEDFSSRQRRPIPHIPGEILNYFRAYDWPGNIRELRNLWERLIIMSCGNPVSAALLPAKMMNTHIAAQDRPSASMDLTSREKMLIFTALKQCNWNQSKSAQKLGITRNTLRYRMKKYDLSRNTVIQ